VALPKVIPGTKMIKCLEENLGALKINLTKGEIKQIRDLMDAAEAH
jgi:aryl-alcohol dehydrogenase-like predicted oxidoreductase